LVQVNQEEVNNLFINISIMFENPLSNPFMVSPASDRKLLAGKPVQ
jgi:hypothetical protein